MSQTFLQVQPVYLSGSGITATATTIILKSLKFPQGDTVLTADLGDICYATLEPNTSREEIISFTTITQNSDGTATLTGVTRNLDYASPYTQISSTGYAHAGGTALIISNNPQVYEDMTSNKNNESITGTWTFSRTAQPRYDLEPTFGAGSENHFINKKYADDLVIAGAPDASTTTKGIVEQATSAETIAGDDGGGTTAPLFATPSDIAKNIQSGTFVYEADAEATDDYVIALTPTLTALKAGQSIYFKANTANTGACSLNVDGLGAKAIKKLHDQDTENGDIESGSIIHVIYDGTNWQMQTPQATMPTTAILTEMSTFFGSTDITGAEAEDLTDGSNATALHTHDLKQTLIISTASDDLKASLDTQRSGTTVIKELLIKPIVGTIRTSFDLKIGNAGTDAVTGRIWINGVATGTERTSTDNANWATYSEDITLLANNGGHDSTTVRLLGERTGASTVALRNFRISYAEAETVYPYTLNDA